VAPSTCFATSLMVPFTDSLKKSAMFSGVMVRRPFLQFGVSGFTSMLRASEKALVSLPVNWRFKGSNLLRSAFRSGVRRKRPPVPSSSWEMSRFVVMDLSQRTKALSMKVAPQFAPVTAPTLEISRGSTLSIRYVARSTVPPPASHMTKHSPGIRLSSLVEMSCCTVNKAHASGSGTKYTFRRVGNSCL